MGVYFPKIVSLLQGRPTQILCVRDHQVSVLPLYSAIWNLSPTWNPSFPCVSDHNLGCFTTTRRLEQYSRSGIHFLPNWSGLWNKQKQKRSIEQKQPLKKARESSWKGSKNMNAKSSSCKGTGFLMASACGDSTYQTQLCVSSHPPGSHWMSRLRIHSLQEEDPRQCPISLCSVLVLQNLNLSSSLRRQWRSFMWSPEVWTGWPNPYRKKWNPKSEASCGSQVRQHLVDHLQTHVQIKILIQQRLVNSSQLHQQLQSLTQSLLEDDGDSISSHHSSQR